MKKLLALMAVLLLIPISAYAGISKAKFNSWSSNVYKLSYEQLIELESMVTKRLKSEFDFSYNRVLSDLSLSELIELKEKVNAAILENDEIKEVTVPEGTWIVGKDIPAGHWTIRPVNDFDYFYVSVFDAADETGKGPKNAGIYWSSELKGPNYALPYGIECPKEVDIDLKEGWYFKTGGVVIFSPYIGHPDFGF